MSSVSHLQDHSYEHIRPFDQESLFEMIKWNTTIKKMKLLNIHLGVGSLGKSLEANVSLKELIMKGVKGDMSLLGDYDLHIEDLEIHNTGFLYGDRTDCMCGRCGIEEISIDLSKMTFPKKLILDNVQLAGKFFIPENLLYVKITKLEDYDLDEIFECLKTNTTLKALHVQRLRDKNLCGHFFHEVQDKCMVLWKCNTTLESLCLDRNKRWSGKCFFGGPGMNYC